MALSTWYWVERADDLHDFLAQVIVGAPDEFIQFDFVPPGEELNLSRAFEEIERGIGFFEKSGLSPTDVSQIRALAEQSLSAYRAGEQLQGASLLQSLQKRFP